VPAGGLAHRRQAAKIEFHERIAHVRGKGATMQTAVKILAQLSYFVTGAIMLLLGASVLLAGAGMLPALQSSLMEEAKGNLDFVHVLQEFATLLVFAGLVTIWFVFHYDQSLALHWATTLFFALLAIVHWFDVRGRSDFATGDLVIGIPFFWFAVLGALRASTQRGSEKQAVADS
jgi:hypothetical protein